MPLLWYVIVTVSPAGHTGTGLLAGVAAAVAAWLAGYAATQLLGHRPPRAGAVLISTAARQASGRGRPIRQLDPDAAGRPRPRAPSRNR
jgi:hypothetical protein